MGAQAAFLGNLQGFVPKDGPIGTSLHKMLLSDRLVRIDEDNTILTYGYGTIAGGL
jgi:hypothetical protein